MARQLLTFEEFVAIVGASDIPPESLDKLRARVEDVVSRKPRAESDNVIVASGFGVQSGRGFVELSIDDTLVQMSSKKAREIGMMLLTGAEAADSDEIVAKLLSNVGTSVEGIGALLLELRELRQGTKGTSYPQ